MNAAFGAVLLALLLANAMLKAHAGELPELLWASHVNSALLAVGLLLRVRALIGMAFLFHLGVAAPAYLLHLLAHGETNWASFLLHVLSPVFGWLACRGQPLPHAAIWRAFALYLALVAIARLVTPEALNVNLTFQPWAESPVTGIWPNRILSALLVLVQLAAARWVFHKLGQGAGGKSALAEH